MRKIKFADKQETHTHMHVCIHMYTHTHTENDTLRKQMWMRESHVLET